MNMKSNVSTISEMSRRALVASGVGATLSAFCGCSAATGKTEDRQAPSVKSAAFAGLKDIAESKGMFYGAAFFYELLASPEFTRAIDIECDVIVPETDMKWGQLAKKSAVSDYSRTDKFIDFAIAHKKKVRGHTAAWYRNVPDWATQQIRDTGKLNILYDHVKEVVAKYKDTIFEWDVVNEAIEPNDGLPGGLRNSLYLQKGGVDYIAQCFRAAHEANPAATLCYNEYGLDYFNLSNEARRTATLKLLEDLLKKSVPIHALGIQAHLRLGGLFNAGHFAKFLDDVAALGLKITITELDVDDRSVSNDPALRDQKVAEHTRQYLDCAFSQQAVRGLVTWGLTDRYTWLNVDMKRADKHLQRPLPLAADMTRKPMWQAIADAYLQTSVRKGNINAAT